MHNSWNFDNTFELLIARVWARYGVDANTLPLLDETEVSEALALVLMQIIAAFLATRLVSMAGWWTVERRATFDALYFIVSREGFRCVLIFGMLFLAFIVIVFRFLAIDLFTCVVVLLFVAFLDIVRTEAFGADEGRRMFNVETRILSLLVESQGIGVKLLQAVKKPHTMRPLRLVSWMIGEKGRGCAILGFTSTFVIATINLVTRDFHEDLTIVERQRERDTWNGAV